MKFATQSRECRAVSDAALRTRDKPPQARVVHRRRMEGGELRSEAFDGTLRLHDLADRHPSEVKLNGKCLGKQSGIAISDARATARADLYLHNALSLEGAQRIPRHDA